jgi:hypothetical protein
MMPMLPAVRPPDLAGTPNGKLWPNQLTTILLPGIGMGTLHKLMVRALNCLFLVAKQETGQTLTATSLADCYRSYAMQRQVFYDRYSPIFIAGKTTMNDGRLGPDGKRWFLKLDQRGVPFSVLAGFDADGNAKSNHGDGIAIDLQLWDDKNKHGMYLNSNALFWAWLTAPGLVKGPWAVGTGSNIESFGLSFELVSEPWHVHLATATPTKRVLDIEAFLGVKP